jgi:hypothetical protein
VNVPKHGDTVLVVWTKDRRTGLYDTKTFDGEPHIRTADEVLVPVGQGVVSVVPPKPRVVCLSGSMRFEREMRAAAVDLSLEGHIVTGPFVNMKRPDPRWATDELADPIKVALDALHFRKIDLADEIVVVSDETGYVGESTRNEIAYAEKHGKPVRHLRITAGALNSGDLYRDLVDYVSGWLEGNSDEPMPASHWAGMADGLVEAVRDDVLAPELERRDAMYEAAERQYAEVTGELRAELDRYKAAHESTQRGLIRMEVQRDEARTEAEAIRGALREVGEDTVPPNVTTLAAVQWLIGEHQALAAQNEELGAEASALANERDEWKRAAEAEAQGRQSERDILAWLHAEAVWRLRGMARRVGEIRQSLRFADAHVPRWEQIISEHKAEIVRLRRWVDRFRAGLRTVTEERDALRAQLADAVVLPADWYHQLAAAESGHRAAAVIAQWRQHPASPATSEPARDRLSVVADAGLDFPDCLTDYAQGQVSAYERAIEECEGWAQDLDRAYAAPFLDVARWLEGRVGWFRERATQAQSGVDLAVAETAPRAEFAPGAVVKWTGDTGWFVGRIIGPTSADTLRSAGLSFPGEKVWDAEVTDLGTFYAGKDHQLGATVHLTEERIEFAQDDEPLSEEFLTLARKAHAEIEGHLAENPVPSPAAAAPRRPPFPYEARQWMEDGARVECFSGKNPDDVVHEGWIIGMTEAPTVRVQKDDGQIISWVLGITRRKPEASGTTPRVWRRGDPPPLPGVDLLEDSLSGDRARRTPAGWQWCRLEGREVDSFGHLRWEELFREDGTGAMVEVLPNTEQEAGR